MLRTICAPVGHLLEVELAVEYRLLRIVELEYHDSIFRQHLRQHQQGMVGISYAPTVAILVELVEHRLDEEITIIA